MKNTISAKIITTRRIVIDQSFPFYDLPSFLQSLSPTRIIICFHRSLERGSIIYLTLTFNEENATNSISLFKETLIRSELEIDVDCTFSDEEIDLFTSPEWLSVEIQPEAIALPSRKEIAVTVPLLDVAVELFHQATFTASDLCYKVILEPSYPDPESARKLIPALAELQGKRNIAGLENAVRLSFDLIRCGGWSCEEHICIPKSIDSVKRPQIEVLLHKYLNSSIGFLPDELLTLHWSDSKTNITNDTLQKKVARLRKQDFLEQLFFRVLPSTPHTAIIESFRKACNVYGTECVRGDYAFVSYAHTNSDFVRLLLEKLGHEGVRYWYDSHITSGSIWDEELENRIRNAGVLIACVSDAYQESKYCKRELKFADLIGKKILPISPSNWTWGEGLQMMFHELQVANFDGGYGFRNFHQMLQTVAPQVFNL